MSAHTPGPWRSEEYILPGPHPDEDAALRDYKFEVVADREGYAEPHVIVQTHALPGGGDFDDQLNEHGANARLISAAPELLAALRSLIKVAPENCDDAEDDPEQAEAWAAARAAIAKATTP